MAELTLTMRARLLPTPEQQTRLAALCSTFADCCNDVADHIDKTRTLSQKKINKAIYHQLREAHGLLAQMTQSAIRRVIANYKAIHTRINNLREENKNGETRGGKKRKIPEYYGIKPQYAPNGCDLLWNRDYSYSQRTEMFSLPVMDGRIKVKAEWKNVPDQYRLGRFGTARLIRSRDKWYLLIPVTIQTPDVTEHPKTIVGVDLGIRFLATSYDGEHTTFHDGKEVKHRRGRYKTLRKELQQRGTRSARKRLKAIGSRENRWMTDVNHQVSKALVNQYGRDTLFALEDLEGIRNATERVRMRQRYVQVSWAFSQLRSFIGYKAARNGQATVAVDPAYTSQTCPRCGHVSAGNRDKRNHIFICRNCGYRSNDDRIGAMNLRHKGYDLIVMQYDANMIDVAGVQPTIP
ncbi:transposase [uncultured Bifidobacterium sp.]|uniref:RNA-guided endonuclease InsQ/TnpB family protein n=1 Tax=uncultured Bifidobacterium sp. TaxID=165187 RepID=UPI002592C7F3|nr:transposase [uncultured Bifidobacterium sp.]